MPSTSGSSVTERTIASIRLTPSAYAHGLAVALPDKVAMVRPTGVERADAMKYPNTDRAGRHAAGKRERLIQGQARE